MTRRLRLKSDGATPREIAFLANQLLLGRINSVGQVMLAAGVTLTTVERPYIVAASVFQLSPLTANAAAALPTTWIVCRAGAADIHHASSALTDLVFNFSVTGG